MKVEFESVLFGLAFLVLALVSMPKKEEAAAESDVASQTDSESATGRASTATAR